MNKKVITKEAVHQVLSDYWQQYRIRPWQSLAAFVLPAIGTILVYFVPPLIVGKIINIFFIQNQISVSTVSGYIVLFGMLWLLGEILWRIGLHFLIRIEGEGMKNLSREARAFA